MEHLGAFLAAASSEAGAVPIQNPTNLHWYEFVFSGDRVGPAT